MEYTAVEFRVNGNDLPNSELADVLTGWLSQMPFESFEPFDTLKTVQTSEKSDIPVREAAQSKGTTPEVMPLLLTAYMPGAEWHENEFKARLDALANRYNLVWDIRTIAAVNWNSEWEKNFPSVRISEKTSIRAHFHPKYEDVEFDLVIDPKMSFGTGHHATTALMLRMLETISVVDQTVLDVGTGTGVLAIFAAKAGAKYVLAIDHDPAAVENARENTATNHVDHIEIKSVDAELFSRPTAGHINMAGSEFETQYAGKFDVILANINRSVILNAMQGFTSALKSKGHLLLSGILEEDVDMITEAAKTATQGRMTLRKVNRQEGWTGIHFIKTL